MAATTTTALVTISNRFTLIWNDFLKGAALAAITAIIAALYTSFSTTPFAIHWQAIGITAGTAFFGYLTKNFLSNTVTLAAPGTPTTAANPPSLTSATKS